MANKTQIRSLLVSFTPPILYPVIRSIMNVSSGFRGSFYSPTWNMIEKGPFKGIQLFFDATTGTGEKELLTGKYDSYFFTYLKKLPVKGKTFFDIGAHIGSSSLPFAQLVGPKGKIVAFEPNIYNFERLRMNIEKNLSLAPRIEVHNIAVSNKNGHENFVFSSNIDDWTSSGSFLSSAHTAMQKDVYEDQLGFKRVQVKTTTLDSFVKTHTQIPDYVKVDVEGAEIFVLQGAQDILLKHKPILFIELHSIFNGYKVTELLKELRYTLTLLHEEKDGRCFIVAHPMKQKRKKT
jgi:FkbM family methyltransferase